MVYQLGLADFVDVNCACPQDAALKYQGGFALAQRKGRMGEICAQLDRVGCAYSLKTRVGDF